MAEHAKMTATVAHYDGAEIQGRILITEEIPSSFQAMLPWQGAARAFFDEQAAKIVGVLVHTLPGGTLDRVLAQLLARSVSLHRIPWIKDGQWPEVSNG